MKQLYRALPFVLSVGLFGCGNSTPQENTNSTTASTENKDNFTSQLPDTAPIVKVATTGTMPPFSFQDDYGNMQGIDIDSIRAIGEEQGFKVEFYKETWQDMFDTVESGARDIAISGISYKDDRNTRYGLSKPYFFNPSAMMYAEGKLNAKSLQDLKNVRIGAMEGAKPVDQLNELGGYEDNLTTNTTAYLLYEDLVQDRVDVILHDMPILQYTAKNYPQYKVDIVPYEGEDNPSAQQVILMAKGNSALINNVNEGVIKLKEKGTFKEIEEKWLGSMEPDTNSEPTSTQAN